MEKKYTGLGPVYIHVGVFMKRPISEVNRLILCRLTIRPASDCSISKALIPLINPKYIGLSVNPDSDFYIIFRRYQIFRQNRYSE